MEALDAGTLLRCWEEGRFASPPKRALALLAHAGEGEVDVLADLTLGERHRRLLALYAANFGEEMELVLVCPACEAKLSTTVSASGFFEAPGASEVTFEVEGRTLTLRPVTTADLVALDAAAPHEARVRQLLQACVRTAQGDELSAADLASVVEIVAERLGDCDPLAEIRLESGCAECGASFVSDLDVVELCWSAVEREARRVAHEVTEIARAFGWSEREILAMSSARRGTYLELARA